MTEAYSTDSAWTVSGPFSYPFSTLQAKSSALSISSSWSILLFRFQFLDFEKWLGYLWTRQRLP